MVRRGVLRLLSFHDRFEPRLQRRGARRLEPTIGVLIDDYLPYWDVRERHRIRVAASPERVFAALGDTDLAAAPIVRLLLGARALPGALMRGGAGMRSLARRVRAPITLRSFEERGFTRLAERAPTELVIGLEGRFWRPDGDLSTPPAATFASTPPAAGTARAVWNFTLAPTGDGTTDLTTETRVLCADDATRRRFVPYWLLIRPGSGLIRRCMLRAVRRAAERGSVRTSR